MPFETSHSVRLAARQNLINQTSGLAPSYIQANLLILPKQYAPSFRALCARNPVPCPLLAESASPGDPNNLLSHLKNIPAENLIHPSSPLDIRTDCPKYNVYTHSVLTHSHIPDILSHWSATHIAFLIGCSFSFEAALSEAGLTPGHVTAKTGVPMYRTNIPLCPAGVFTDSTYVVSMRMYPSNEIERVREVTSRFGSTHGEPIAWGWEAVERIGVKDVLVPDWGDAPVGFGGGEVVVGSEEYVPVFWGCGVTPQEAVMRAGLEGVVMGHAPGHMLVLDVRGEELIGGEKEE